MMSPHGIPIDLLDRLVIIRTLQYVLEEIIAILNTRAKVRAFLQCLHIKSCLHACWLQTFLHAFDAGFSLASQFAAGSCQRLMCHMLALLGFKIAQILYFSV